MNYTNHTSFGTLRRIGLRPAAHASLPHSVQVFDDWEHSGLGTSYGSTALLAGLGEFHERRHFFSEVVGGSRRRLAASLPSGEGDSFAEAFVQMQSSTASKADILNREFMMTEVIRSHDFQPCRIPTVCLSIGETAGTDNLYMPLRDTCGCSSHSSANMAMFDAIREMIERQILLKFWLTAVARRRLSDREIHSHLNSAQAMQLYTSLKNRGNILAIDISESNFPGKAILIIFQGTFSAVQFCAGLGFCRNVGESLKKALIELWQTYRFMDRFAKNRMQLEDIDEPYLLHFMHQNTSETFDIVNSFSESHEPTNDEKLDLTSLISGAKSADITGYFYLKEVTEGEDPIYYSKFISPDCFMHMNNSRNINLRNRFSAPFFDSHYPVKTGKHGAIPMNKPSSKTSRVLITATILIKEQLNEPFAFLWILASPTAMFYFYFLQPHKDSIPISYLKYTGWFYGYVAVTVAMFGFTFYLIGRRESGFVRSFIYHRSAQIAYLSSHFIAYSIVAIAYALLYYMVTKPAFGPYDFVEMGYLATRFYLAFFSMTGIASLLSLIPMKFNSAGMLFSVISLSLIAMSGIARQSENYQYIASLNPLTYLEMMFTQPLSPRWVGAIVIFNLTAFLLTVSNFRVNPVWNRY